MVLRKRKYSTNHHLLSENIQLMSLRILLIVLLILAISISPRIRLGMLETGRNIDLRYEDFILVLIIILWSLRIFVREEKIYFSPLFKPITIYIYLATLSTGIGIFFGWIAPAMAFFFLVKEIEYLLIFIVVVNLIKTYDELKIIVYSFLICAVANGVYSFYQILSGTLIGSRSGYYGVASLGEPSSFSTGGYFLITCLVSMAIFFLAKKKIMKLISATSTVLCVIGWLGSGSRANVIGGLFAFSIFGRLITKIKGVRYVFVIGFVIFIFFTVILVRLPTMTRITNVQQMQLSYIQRAKLIYISLWNEAPKYAMVFGLGKSATTTLLGGTGEAHNHYLRIFIEMGILGLVSFLYLLSSIIKMSLELNKNSQYSLGKAMAVSCLLVTLSLMIASIAQDAFLPVKVNETFWVVVGLCCFPKSEIDKMNNRLLLRT